MSAAIFLFIGLDAERRNQPKATWPDTTPDEGFLGLVERIDSFAAIVDSFLGKADGIDFPGVFHYDVTESLGAWLFSHIDASPEECLAEVARFVNAWKLPPPELTTGEVKAPVTSDQVAC